MNQKQSRHYRHTGEKRTGKLETKISGVEEWTLWNGYEVQRRLLLHINIQQKALILEEALNNQVDKIIQPVFAVSYIRTDILGK